MTQTIILDQKPRYSGFHTRYNSMVKTQTVKMLHDSGLRQIEIATMLRVTPDMIRRHMRRAGIKPRNGRPPSRPIGPRISYAAAGVI